MPEETQKPTPRCRHLRSNALYLFDALPEDDEGYEYGSSACWCQHTMKSIGPDDDLVGLQECRVADRTCYEPL